MLIIHKYIEVTMRHNKEYSWKDTSLRDLVAGTGMLAK